MFRPPTPPACTQVIPKEFAGIVQVPARLATEQHVSSRRQRTTLFIEAAPIESFSFCFYFILPSGAGVARLGEGREEDMQRESENLCTQAP